MSEFDSDEVRCLLQCNDPSLESHEVIQTEVLKCSELGRLGIAE